MSFLEQFFEDNFDASKPPENSEAANSASTPNGANSFKQLTLSWLHIWKSIRMISFS